MPGSEGFAEIQSVTYRVPLGGPRREIWLAKTAGGGRSPEACGT
jgi:hypothetical protein